MKIYKKARRLWLDDLRPMPSDFDIWAKTVDEAKGILSNSNDIDFISFDNDLGLELEGRHLAAWIEEKAFLGEINRMGWRVHSQNPIGGTDIFKAMTNADRFWDNHENI